MRLLYAPHSYRCAECGESFPTYQLYLAHLRETKHKGRYKYRCAVCGREFITEDEYVQHLREHEDMTVEEIDKAINEQPEFNIRDFVGFFAGLFVLRQLKRGMETGHLDDLVERGLKTFFEGLMAHPEAITHLLVSYLGFNYADRLKIPQPWLLGPATGLIALRALNSPNPAISFGAAFMLADMGVAVMSPESAGMIGEVLDAAQDVAGRFQEVNDFRQMVIDHAYIAKTQGKINVIQEGLIHLMLHLKFLSFNVTVPYEDRVRNDLRVMGLEWILNDPETW